MHDVMADYMETWTILQNRLRKHTRNRAYLFGQTKEADGSPSEYEIWLESTTYLGLCDAIENQDKWDRRFSFHQFAFLRLNMLVAEELQKEIDYRKATRVAETPDTADYGSWSSLESMVERDQHEPLLDEAVCAAFLKQMSPDQVEALALRYGADLQVKEMARLMERSASAVSVLIHRGKDRLKQLLTDNMSKSELDDLLGSLITTRPRARDQLGGEDGDPPPLNLSPNNVIEFPPRRASL